MRPSLRHHADERGQALFMALGLLLVLSLVPVVLVRQSSAALSQGASAIDQHAAMAATQAGLNDYLDLLATNPNYVVYGADNPPSPPNPAFTGWTPVPGGSLNPPEFFRYTPDMSVAAQTGIVRLTVSGKAGAGSQSVVQTVRFGVRKASYLDYLYFTDYETGDPANNSDPNYQSYCAYYLDQYNPMTGGYGPDPNTFDGGNQCQFIQFGSQDALRGPVHSNDGFLICGSPTFQSSVTSSVFPTGSAGQRWVSNCDGSNPSFARAGDPAYVPQMAMPPSDTTLASEATAPATGCLYTGVTTIAFHDNGTMDVVSPLSKAMNGCQVGTNVAQPANGVIYVQNVPASPADPNYSPTSTCSSYKNQATGATGCNGDAIVGDAQAADGGVKGQLTVAAQNNVVIDGNLQYAGGLTGADVLGLVAGNYIEVNHPVQWGSNVATCTEGATPPDSAHTAPNCDLNNPTIDAALLSVAHSFLVNNYFAGSPLGNLTINGSIAQKYRGAVGEADWTGTIVYGYAKNYTYDPRLQYLSPPYFLDPASSAYQMVSFTQLPAAY